MSLPLKTLLRNSVSALLYRLGFTQPVRTGSAALTIVTFHRVLPAELRSRYPHSGLAITAEIFAACLDYFAAHYRCLTVSDAWTALREGPSSKPLLALTFDDGQADNCDHARPLLNAKGVPATFYIPVEAIERGEPLWHDRLGFAAAALLRTNVEELAQLAPWLRDASIRRLAPADIIERITQGAKRLLPDERERLIGRMADAGQLELPAWAGMMTWEQIRQLAGEGHEIGSHTWTHPLLRDEFRPDRAREIGASRTHLEGILKRPIRSFAYPNGDYDAATLQAVRAAGYETAVTTRRGRNRKDADPFTLARHDLDESRFRNRRGGLATPVLAWRLSRADEMPPC